MPPIAPDSHAEEALLVRRSGLFDPAWYLATFPDVAAAGMDPLDHYLRHGGFEGRRASPVFDTAWYRRAYPDVVGAGVNPLVHYLRHGWREGRRAFRGLDGSRLIGLAWDEASGRPHPLLAEVETRRVPEFLRRQRREAAALDFSLEPDAGPIFLSDLIRFPHNDALVGALERIHATIENDFTHLVAVPWMVRGGADLVSAHIVQAIRERHGPRAALFMATDHTDRSAADWLPEGTRTLYLRDLLPDAPAADIDALFTQFVVQYRPRTIVNVNSSACWRAFDRHGRQFAGFSRLYAFLFGFGYADNGARHGPAVEHFRQCLPHMTGVCFDTQYFRRVLIEHYGVTRDGQARLATVYSPVQDGVRAIDRDALAARLGLPRSERRRVMWASRVAPEKIPGMLLDIARAMPHMDFAAYGDAVLGGDNPLRKAALPNFEYRGGYAGFHQLPLHEFDVFLYTSLFDGLPTVLIAVQAAGLPIVAPCVGGVPELVTEETAWPLPANATLADYCAALDAAAHSPERSRPKAEAGMALSRRRHSWDAYVTQLEAAGVLA